MSAKPAGDTRACMSLEGIAEHDATEDNLRRNCTVNIPDRNKFALQNDYNIRRTTSTFTGEREVSFGLVMNDGNTITGRNSKGVRDMNRGSGTTFPNDQGQNGIALAQSTAPRGEIIDAEAKAVNPVPPVSYPVRNSDGHWTGVINYGTSSAFFAEIGPTPNRVGNPDGNYTGVSYYGWADATAAKKTDLVKENRQPKHTNKPDYTSKHHVQEKHHEKTKAKQRTSAPERGKISEPKVTGETPINLESTCRAGVICPALRIDRPYDQADADTLHNFENTNCHAATQRKMGLNPVFGAATQMDRQWLELQGYQRITVTSPDQLLPGDIVGAPYEQQLWGHQFRSSERGLIGHTGFVEIDPVTRQKMITEKLGDKLPYVRQTPESFAQMWTPKGSFADNEDIWVYRRRLP
jgi:hypothetical protein